ncbi:MAG TPA: hypothetical protein VGN80_19975, partial [Devosiaceae bacterium]|nr:hypothetical protein [Devosiaceae bacterium]
EPVLRTDHQHGAIRSCGGAGSARAASVARPVHWVPAVAGMTAVGGADVLRSASSPLLRLGFPEIYPRLLHLR